MSRDVVMMGSFAYAERLPLGDWQLARAFVRVGCRVLYVDPPLGLGSVLHARQLPAEVRRGRARPAEAGVVVGTPFAVRRSTPWLLEPLQERVVAAQVQRWTRQLGFRDPLLVTVGPHRGRLSGIVRSQLVYWQKDRQHEWQGVLRPDWLLQRHRDLLRAADVVTAVSPAIVEDGRASGVDATLVPNACDPTLFASQADEPADLRALPHPRLVFLGNWNWRLQRDLVPELALRRPDWSFVVIGEPDQPLPANVHVLGWRDVAQAPAYLQHCDVGLVPYVDNVFNDASCPLKIYEYLAAGLPVVASGVEPDPGLDRRLVVVAHGMQGWLEALEDHLAHRVERREAALREAAAQTWDARARRVLELAAAG